MDFSPESVLQGLTAPQREAATTIDGPLLVLAGAGSGKTRTITRRIAYMVACGIPAYNILAITFTNKAAGEMRERVNHMLGEGSRSARGVTVATFHALCCRILRDHFQPANLTKTFSIFDTADQNKMIKQAIKDCGLNTDNFPPAAVLSQISKAKNNLQIASVFAANCASYEAKNIARIYTRYEMLLHQNNGVDFDDLLLKTAIMMRDHADVRKALEEKYQYILIDEYQDTNHAQFLIAHLMAQNHKNICATGDPDQSIYGWRGANLNNILEFEQYYSNAKIVLLEQNYRSTKTVLKAASSLIARNTKRKKKDLWTENEQGDKITLLVTNDEHQEANEVVRRLKEYHDTEKLTWDKFAVFYRVNSLSRVLEDAFMKAAIPYQIARGTEFYARKEIKDIIAYLHVISNPTDGVHFERIINVPPRGLGDTSVNKVGLYASRQDISMLEACRQAAQVEGLPARAVNACRKLAESIAAWRAVAVPDAANDLPPEPAAIDDFAAPAPVEEEPSLNDLFADSEEITPDPSLNEAEAEYSQLLSDPSALAANPLPETLSSESNPPFVILGGIRGLLDRIYKESGLEAELTKKDGDDPDRERAANIEELINVAAEFDSQNPTGTLDDFLAQVSLASDVDKLNDSGGAVTLMTLHAAKGLEFPWVAIVGMEDGLIPHARAISGFSPNADELEEERRLAFVGITRAMKKLTIANARYRMVRGETVRTVASQFLTELPSDCLDEVDFTGGDHEPVGSLNYHDEEGYERRAQHQREQQRSHESSTQRSQADALAHQFRKGQLVRHPQFGLGRIEDITAAGTMTRASVRFQGYPTPKTLILQYARLEKVDS